MFIDVKEIGTNRVLTLSIYDPNNEYINLWFELRKDPDFDVNIALLRWWSKVPDDAKNQAFAGYEGNEKTDPELAILKQNFEPRWVENHPKQLFFVGIG
ncbi:hypothetical protein [Spirosoma endbachense]|uniref:Uncharacterized protein n=1 Tax=Spirosoma endbachense TaxID=2666025 RepID=A0A6P1VYS6_9BACT|nr:hypothetical protein [Spirosoma endbachense]QHV97935.1 hypothetical protein GJR95_24295 [Spirosoma endbachense]